MTEAQKLNKLTPQQLDQLIKAVAYDGRFSAASDAFMVLKHGPKLSDEQQQILVNRIAYDSHYAACAVNELHDLNEGQKAKLTSISGGKAA